MKLLCAIAIDDEKKWKNVNDIRKLNISQLRFYYLSFSLIRKKNANENKKGVEREKKKKIVVSPVGLRKVDNICLKRAHFRQEQIFVFVYSFYRLL